MSEIPTSNEPRRTARRWRRSSAATIAAFVATLAATASVASSAAADATAPPPVTILTHGNVGHGDFFISPFGDPTTYAQRSRDPRPEWQRRLVPGRAGR